MNVSRRLWLISIAAIVVLAGAFLVAWRLPVSDFVKGLVGIPAKGDKRGPALRILGFKCGGPYADHTLTADEFSTVLSNHQAWLKSLESQSGAKTNDERRANLCRAKFSEVRNMFYGADLRGAIFSMTNLHEVDFSQAELKAADFSFADLRGVSFSEANLERADLSGANLAGVIYEPNPESFPLLWTLTSPNNQLDKLVFNDTPAALVALREAFKKAGMRTQERQLTYALEHTRRLEAWNPSWFFPGGKDTRPWLEKAWGKFESGFRLVAFELPSHYGMAPRRALWGLLGFIPCFPLFYWILLQNASNRSGLWMIVPADRIAPGRGKEKIVRIRPHPAKTWRERFRSGSRLFCTSLYFSLLSAFHLGWRELNVGTWIARMQPREYTLRATGWVRTVSGIQSLLSVYLLALWVLTYFGRPFE